MSGIWQRLLGIPPEEATFARRGFHSGAPEVRQRLEEIGRTFLCGYHEALSGIDSQGLAGRLNLVVPEMRGFAFEGAAMGLSLLDHLTPWKRDRLQTFLHGSGRHHPYMIHVGVGWAIARLPWLRRRAQSALVRLDPLLRWLAVDGYGFHEGYFHWRRYLKARAVPEHLSPYARRVFDQGLGRSLWFVEGADVDRISDRIGGFTRSRQSALWSGVGLAAAYAGGLDKAGLKELKEAAGAYLACLAQGAAFAAKTRERASNAAEHTDTACRLICGISAREAARITDRALENLPDDKGLPSYEAWRRRIQSEFVLQEALA